MATKSLTFDIYGRDKTASSTIRGIGKEAEGLGTRMSGVARGIAAAGAAALAGLVVAGTAFAIESVKAYAEAEESQTRLEDAYKRFPKLADTNIEALRDLNTELMKKTRFDDDALAVGQSILAQYDLTGQQLEDLTPLLADYAAKTGKDIPSAAEDLGKAILGQGRALKDIGIDFQDTGTAAGNFDQLVAGLRSQVSGFAEEDASTASGQLDILRNRFGEVQEKIGEALMPALQELADWMETDGLPAIEGFAGWLTDTAIPAIQEFGAWLGGNKDVLGPAALAVGVLTAAVWLLNFAMYANPVTWFAVVLALAIALATTVTIFFDDIDAWISKNPWVLLFAPLVGGVGVATLLFNTLTRKADEVQAGFESIGSAIANLPNVIRSALGGAASWLFSAGVNMVRGFINGIQTMVGQAAQTAANMAADAIAAAKSALHIKSPSRVFMEIGAYTAEGFKLGIESGTGPVMSAVESMVAAPKVVAASSPASSAGSAVTVVVQSAGGIDLSKYIDVQVQNQGRRTQVGLENGKQAYR